MKIKTVKIKNFRSYRDEISIDFGDLTTFVGKNDIGKSTILEALDVFFNEGKGVVKLDKDDINKQGIADGDKDIIISILFTELPENIIIDSTNETTLEREYLLNNIGCLEIIKKYPNAGSAKVFIKALHPTNPNCSNLLLKKNTDYKKIIRDNGIECSNQSINAVMRSSIWSHFSDDLQCQETEIDVTKEDAKNIWDKLQCYLPQYSLFQSDRKNSDSDNEVQDPLKEAVKQILADAEICSILADVADRVENRLKEVSESTLNKLQEMNPELASILNPVIPSHNSLKWQDVFKSVSICSDENIPINKRGSGVKRLILINFFRAEAERRLGLANSRSIIYAIEEPETSQHFSHQKILINAFKELASADNTQVLLTTHSPVIVKELNFDNLRLISQIDGLKKVESVLPNQLPYPSLNEVNFLAFTEITEEYHNELYGFIEALGDFNAYKNGKPAMKYIKPDKKGNTKEEEIVLTEYIRHQIHHPENSHNKKYSFEQLQKSIELMREFIQTSRS